MSCFQGLLLFLTTPKERFLPAEALQGPVCWPDPETSTGCSTAGKVVMDGEYARKLLAIAALAVPKPGNQVKAGLEPQRSQKQPVWDRKFSCIGYTGQTLHRCLDLYSWLDEPLAMSLLEPVEALEGHPCEEDLDRSPKQAALPE